MNRTPLSILDFRPDQREDFSWLHERDEGFLVLPVGYGKTAIALAAFTVWRVMNPTWRALVLSTKKIVEYVWEDEINLWKFSTGLTYAAATGKNLRKASEARPDVLGVNFESIERFYDLVDRDPTLLPEVLIIDESSKMKAHDANRVKRHCGFIARGGYVDRFKKRVALSATPCAEGYHSFWAQEQCISWQHRLGLNITTFRARYCRSYSVGAHASAVRYYVPEENEKLVEDALGPDFLRISKKDDYSDLAPYLHRTIEVPWDAKDYAQYKELEAKFLLDVSEYADLDVSVEDAFGDEGVVVASNKAVLWNKLRQISSGFLYGEQGLLVTLPGSKAKIEALRRIVDSAAGEPILVFAQYRAEFRMILDAFPKAQIGLPPHLKDWNDGKIALMALHPRSAGHGLNLQYGSATAVWYSLPWSYEEWHQANGRLRRPGQRRQVSILRLERPDSIEQVVWEGLQEKSMRLSTFITRMRARQGEGSA